MSNFTLMSSDLTLKSLSDFEGKKKVISIVPYYEKPVGVVKSL